MQVSIFLFYAVHDVSKYVRMVLSKIREGLSVESDVLLF
jgi:hypothetical protein